MRFLVPQAAVTYLRATDAEMPLHGRDTLRHLENAGYFEDHSDAAENDDENEEEEEAGGKRECWIRLYLFYFLEFSFVAKVVMYASEGTIYDGIMIVVIVVLVTLRFHGFHARLTD